MRPGCCVRGALVAKRQTGARDTRSPLVLTRPTVPAALGPARVQKAPANRQVARCQIVRSPAAIPCVPRACTMRYLLPSWSATLVAEEVGRVAGVPTSLPEHGSEHAAAAARGCGGKGHALPAAARAQTALGG